MLQYTWFIKLIALIFHPIRNRFLFQRAWCYRTFKKSLTHFRLFKLLAAFYVSVLPQVNKFCVGGDWDLCSMTTPISSDNAHLPGEIRITSEEAGCVFHVINQHSLRGTASGIRTFTLQAIHSCFSDVVVCSSDKMSSRVVSSLFLFGLVLFFQCLGKYLCN